MKFEVGKIVKVKHKQGKFKIYRQNKQNENQVDLVSLWSGGLHTVYEDDIIQRGKGVRKPRKPKHHLVYGFSSVGRKQIELTDFGETVILE